MFGRKGAQAPTGDDEAGRGEAEVKASEQGRERSVPTTKNNSNKQQPPTSWYSTFTNPNLLSFLSSAAQEAMAANPEVAKKMDKEQLLKTVSDKIPESKQKNQVMKTIQTKNLDGEQKAQLMQTIQKQGPDIPEKEKLLQALDAQQKANGLLSKALSLKDTAMKCMNPAERQRMLQEAYDKEIEANGQSKWARRLTSGYWQGGMGGAGIGGGVGAGLGTVVGTVVGTVAAVPTTALGGLIGIGVGGIHGPFVKLNQKKAKEVAEREKAKGKSDEEIAEAVQREAGEEVVDEAVNDARDLSSTGGAGADGGLEMEERRPSESNDSGAASRPNRPRRDPNAPRKKPKKLEIRSGGKDTASKPGGKESGATSAE